MIMVNLGCGSCFHAAWINFDCVPSSPLVKRWGVGQPLPFEDGGVDVVYHSHLIEHLPSRNGAELLRECHRILRPNGIIRIVVPDLENIARAYLSALDEAEKGGNDTLHSWTRMELVDQAARSVSGGEMAPWLRKLNNADVVRVRERAGREVDSILGSCPDVAGSKRLSPRQVWWKVRKEFVRALIFSVGGSRLRAALDEGIFRQRGEVHRVMYDRIALARVVTECGFSGATVMAANESAIPAFSSYELDAVDGVVRKPDSLFMEAVKR